MTLIPIISLNANQCPLPLARASFLPLAAAAAGAGNAPCCVTIQRDTMNVPRWNRNATAQDLQGAYGGGIYGICYGLVLTAGTGLTVLVSSGHALIDGLVEVAPTAAVGGTWDVANAASVVVANNTARVWIWLLQTGVVVAVNTSLAPPAAQACLLGSVTTSGGVVTGIDTSGVMYLRSGRATRYTNDSAAPTDAPSSKMIFETITPSEDYRWNGSAHLPLTGGSSVAAHPIRKITASASVVSGDEAIWIDANAGNVTLTLPNADGSVVKYLVVKRLDSSSNTVTIAAASGQNIDGASSVTIVGQYTTRAFRAGQSALVGAWGVE